MSIADAFIHMRLVVRLIKDPDQDSLQSFLDLFDDFFLQCEGEKGLAQGLLTACPDSKDLAQDKFLLMIYEKNEPVCLMDLVRDYPEEGVWTIGYLLVHPLYRNKGKGSYFVTLLSNALSTMGARKMRCIVQNQNPGALRFWVRCGFYNTGASKHLSLTNTRQFVLKKDLCRGDPRSRSRWDPRMKPVAQAARGRIQE